MDELKKFLEHELAELKQSKIRAVALGVCLAVLIIFAAIDDASDGEEILIDEPPLTKDLPVKVLPVTKRPDGVTKVLGANANALVIGDPFAFEEKPKPPPPPPTLPKIPEPPVVIEPPPEPEIEPPKPSEPIILTGTAISGANKTAMFLRGKETVFKTVGEDLDGRLIVDITPDFVTFADGERVQVGIRK